MDQDYTNERVFNIADILGQASGMGLNRNQNPLRESAEKMYASISERYRNKLEPEDAISTSPRKPADVDYVYQPSKASIA